MIKESINIKSSAEFSHQEALNIVKGHKFLDIQFMEQSLLYAQECYDQIAELNFDKVIILAAGGSSMSGRTLCQIFNPSCDKVTFMDTMDPLLWEDLLNKIDLKSTLVLSISASGETVEILYQIDLLMNYFKSHLGYNYSKHFINIIAPRNNTLANISQENDLKVFEYPEGIGGRFAIFTILGFLPLMLSLGKDKGAQISQDLIEGFKLYQNNWLNTYANKGVEVNAIYANHVVASNRYADAILLIYSDILLPLGPWYRQLWAESLGKGGKGITPVFGGGPIDQHSQLQLYLEGPDNKIFTVITYPDNFANKLEGKIGDKSISMIQLLNLEAEATIKALESRGRIVHRIILEGLTFSLRHCELSKRASLLRHLRYDFGVDQQSKEERQENLEGLAHDNSGVIVGELVAKFTLGMLLLAKFWGINPEGQPSVEIIKNNINKLL